jgi:uncharacterized membrane protein YccC
VGAVLGAIILIVVPYGPWLLIPFAILAAGLPYARARNFGLVATFLTPLVVLLIDLLVPAGWKLAEDRLIDTVIGCAVVLLVGYAPWPASWQAHLPAQFAGTLRAVCQYVRAALAPQAGEPGGPGGPEAGGPEAGGPGGRRQRSPGGLPQWSRMRRQTNRALSDLRAEFQRTLAEPPAISRLATAWWPAEVALEDVVDTATAVAVSVSQGQPPPSRQAIDQLTSALDTISHAIETGTAPPAAGPLPDDESLKPVTSAVRGVLSVLTPSEYASRGR